jgi:hypothetical protein
MRRWSNELLAFAGGVLLLALLPPSACRRGTLGGEDGGGGLGGSAGGPAPRDAVAEIETVGQDARAETGRDAPTTGVDAARDAFVDAARDALVEAPPPPGLIPCGFSACDPARQFCVHYVGGIGSGMRFCMTLPGGCAAGGTDCACLLGDAGPFFCYACRAVSGVDVTGLELDCPGPLD